MIPDHQTNTVYYADATRYNYLKDIKAFKSKIEGHGYKCIELKEADDYYCRDFMPVQISNKEFVQFVFRPKRYIKQNEPEFIANPVKVEIINNLKQPRYSSIILDGGNIIKWSDKVIVTERVFSDNKHQFKSDAEIHAQLEKDLRCKVIIIPEYPNEATGHADGLIRFIDGDTVLINETEGEPEKKWLKKFLSVLSENQLLHIKIPCPMVDEQETADGLYINYLQVGNLILVPQFGLKDDKKALGIFNDVYKNDYTIEPFKARWIAENGGVLNCATWTIKT